MVTKSLLQPQKYAGRFAFSLLPSYITKVRDLGKAELINLDPAVPSLSYRLSCSTHNRGLYFDGLPPGLCL